ncbi:MAG: dockerin type I domain-containing protein [Bacillota bacterium]
MADEIPSLPAIYYGTASQDCNGNIQPVVSGTIKAFIDGELRGELTFSGGQYGIPADDPCQPKLLVQGYSSDEGKPVTFMVYINNYPYDAQTNPSPVLWSSADKREINVTAGCGAGVKGFAFLEKIQPSDPEPDHLGTTVKASQSGTETQTTTISSGYYELSGLQPGNCNVEFSRPGWKKAVKSVTLTESGFTEVEPVTLYVGDMNGDGSINILDLLWMASKMGPVTGESQIADVNKDGQVNILDLLRVAQNIGK